MRLTTKAAVYAMFSSYPRSKEAEQSAESYFSMIEIGCAGLPDEAIQETIRDVALQNVKNMNPGFPPTPDVFNRHAASLAERNELVRQRKERPEIAPPKRSHKEGYVHPATGRSNELKRKGYTVIKSDVSLDAMRKNAESYGEGAIWLTTGEVLTPKSNQNRSAA